MAIACPFLGLSCTFIFFYDFLVVMCMVGNQEGVLGVSYPFGYVARAGEGSKVSQ